MTTGGLMLDNGSKLIDEEMHDGKRGFCRGLNEEDRGTALVRLAAQTIITAVYSPCRFVNYHQGIKDVHVTVALAVRNP